MPYGHELSMHAVYRQLTTLDLKLINQEHQMKALMTVLLFGVGLLLTTAALGKDNCSTRALAGNWIFATEVGQFPAFGGDITALGTMNFDKKGNLSGEFDATVALIVFLPDNKYSGSVTVASDCTGTLTFVTDAGTERTDSIAVVSETEIWGMSQDTENLWTYRMRKISGRGHSKKH
jgi:hypothetical protein